MKSLIKATVSPLYRFIRFRKEREFIRLLDRWGKENRYSHRTISFLAYKFKVPDCLSFVWQFKEIFVDEIYRFESMNDSPVIYDCGANIGTSCLYFKEIYPNAKITAFEADPEIASVLETNLLENGLSDVKVIKKAVWIDNEGLNFGTEGADSGSLYRSDNVIKVQSVRLRDLIGKEKSIDMLKIDIEGAEVDLLLDCEDQLSNINNLFVEYHSWATKEQRLDEILGIMTRSGFRYFLKPAVDRESPFINKGKNSEMDLQLNIFAYRV